MAEYVQAFKADDSPATGYFAHFGELHRRSEIITQFKPNMIVEESSSDHTGKSYFSGVNLSQQHSLEGIKDQPLFDQLFSSKHPCSSITRKEESGLNISGLSPFIIEEEARKTSQKIQNKNGSAVSSHVAAFGQQSIEGNDKTTNRFSNQTSNNLQGVHCRHTIHQDNTEKIQNNPKTNTAKNGQSILLFRQQNRMKDEKPSKTKHFQDYITNQKDVIESKLRYLGEHQNRNNILLNFKKSNNLRVKIPPLNTERILSFLDTNQEEQLENLPTYRGREPGESLQIELQNQEELIKKVNSLQQIPAAFSVETHTFSKISAFSIDEQSNLSQQQQLNSSEINPTNHNMTPITTNSLLKSPPPQIFLFSNPYVSPKNLAKKPEIAKTPSCIVLEKAKQNIQFEETKPSQQCSFLEEHTKGCFTSFHCNETQPLAQTQKKQIYRFPCQPIPVPQNQPKMDVNMMDKQKPKDSSEPEYFPQPKKPIIFVKKLPSQSIFSQNRDKKPVNNVNFANAVKAQLSNYEQILDAKNQRFQPTKVNNLLKPSVGFAETHQATSKSDYSKIVNRLYKNLAKTLPRSLVV